MDLKPETDQGRTYRKQHTGSLRLINSKEVDPKVPVQINYFTLYPNPETGKMTTYQDRYGFDPMILKAMKTYLP